MSFGSHKAEVISDHSYPKETVTNRPSSFVENGLGDDSEGSGSVKGLFGKLILVLIVLVAAYILCIKGRGGASGPYTPLPKKEEGMEMGSVWGGKEDAKR